MKGMDYLVTYLVAFDYFSRYVKVAGMEKTTNSTEIIRALRVIFATQYKRSPKKCDLNKFFSLTYQNSPSLPSNK